jgi:hypothetical protein
MLIIKGVYMSFGETPTPDTIREINEAAVPVENEMELRKICSIAWGPTATKEESEAAKATLREMGYDPSYVDDKNARRDFDNPLSAAQCYDQLEISKRR